MLSHLFFLLGLLVLWVGIGIDLHLSMHWLSGLGLLIVCDFALVQWSIGFV